MLGFLGRTPFHKIVARSVCTSRERGQGIVQIELCKSGQTILPHAIAWLWRRCSRYLHE